MAKIDISQIDGYSEMTAEEKIKALEEFNIKLDGFVDKKTFDKKAHEAAEYSRQLKAKSEELKNKLTEEEQAEIDRKAKEVEIQEKYEQLLKETNIAKTKARYLSLGYDEDLASQTAEAFINNESDVVFENQKKFIDSREKAIKAEIIDKQGNLTGGKPHIDVVNDDELKSIREAMGLS